MRLLAVEKPTVDARLGALLRDREAAVEIDGEKLGIGFPDGRFRRTDRVGQPFIELKSSRATVLAVVSGEVTLEDAVWSDRLWLRGSLDDLVLFHDALVLYLQGAVRCPSFPWLLECYQDDRVPGWDEVERRLTRTSPHSRRIVVTRLAEERS